MSIIRVTWNVHRSDWFRFWPRLMQSKEKWSWIVMTKDHKIMGLIKLQTMHFIRKEIYMSSIAWIIKLNVSESMHFRSIRAINLDVHDKEKNSMISWSSSVIIKHVLFDELQIIDWDVFMPKEKNFVSDPNSESHVDFNRSFIRFRWLTENEKKISSGIVRDEENARKKFVFFSPKIF